MPVSPALTEEVGRELVGIYLTAERDLLRHIARRLGADAEVPDWAERKVREIHDLRLHVQRKIMLLRRAGRVSAESAMSTAYHTGARTAIADITQIVGSTTVTLGLDDRALRALVREAVAPIEATHPRILRSVQDIYRNVIADAGSQVLTGSQTRLEAAQRALNKFAGRGVTGFIDKKGRRWDLASYVETAIRSSTGQAAIQGHVDKLQESGHDLIIVSDSPEECPLCRPWEGKVLSISGASDEYPSMAVARGAGLWHANCTHSTGIYIAGVTRALTKVANPIGYDERQHQRYLERQVRFWKRREVIAITARDRDFSARKTADWQRSLRIFVKTHDRKRLRYREQIERAR